MNKTEKEELAILGEKAATMEKKLDKIEEKLDIVLMQKADKSELEALMKKSDAADEKHEAKLASLKTEIKVMQAKALTTGGTVGGGVAGVLYLIAKMMGLI